MEVTVSDITKGLTQIEYEHLLNGFARAMGTQRRFIEIISADRKHKKNNFEERSLPWKYPKMSIKKKRIHKRHYPLAMSTLTVSCVSY